MLIYKEMLIKKQQDIYDISCSSVGERKEPKNEDC